jgi:hypothetical protein
MLKPFFILFLLVIIPIPAFAEEGEDSANLLGWAAIGCGVIANVPFVMINKYRKYAVQSGGTSLHMARQIGTHFTTILNFHIMFNSIGYFAGMSHGLLLYNNMDWISLSLAIVMSILMASGLALRYTSSRNVKVFGRLMHGQFGLMLLLLVFLSLHVLTGDD